MPKKSTPKERTPKLAIDQETYGEIFFQWKIPEYTEHQRSNKWYVYMIVLALVLMIYSWYERNPFFALIIILAIFIAFLKHYYETKKLNFMITEDGIITGEQFFPYTNIDSFFIIYDPPYVKKLFFVSDVYFNFLNIPVLFPP